MSTQLLRTQALLWVSRYFPEFRFEIIDIAIWQWIGQHFIYHWNVVVERADWSQEWGVRCPEASTSSGQDEGAFDSDQRDAAGVKIDGQAAILTPHAAESTRHIAVHLQKSRHIRLKIR
jgi:hypothetical protein